MITKIPNLLQCVGGKAYQSKPPKSALALDDSLNVGAVYHAYRVLSGIPDKHPCFRRHT
jgi:hypothetical protein